MENQARSDATSEGNTTPSIVTDIVAQLAAALRDIINPGQRDSDLPRYDGTYPAANFFQQYDDIAGRAYPTGTKRLQKLPAQLSALKLTPQTTLQGYYKEKTAMGLQLNLPTDIILESLTEGLPTADQRLVRTVSPNSLKDWHDLMARIKGSSVPAPARPTPEPTSSRHNGHITLAREQPSRPYNMPPRFFSTPRLPRHADSSVPSQPPSPCHYCRGNHWNAQCPRRKPSGRNNVFYQETTGRQPRTSLSTARSQPARTISRRLVANGLHSCRPLRRLPLTPPNRRQRLEWCRARSTWMTEWHRVVFSSESRFCLSSDSRRVRVWRRRGERSNPAAIVERPTVRQRGIMVWGAIAYDSRSPLLRIQGTMTAQRYVDDVLRPVTLPYLQGVPNALYQQDNARPHTARISQQALQDVQMLPWPPYSPDLSPIEHVWDIIGRRLHALPQPRSEDVLWQMVEREWRAIPQDAIRTLIDSLPRRVAACIAVRGGPTCY
ncbi:Transposase [Cordylochernes scorpioides]|uniref:Transposase n=1 Tax=Cordylochernes scorpioides TaxID=51811 RepID=A0ABY6KQZ2_9ARAC|nr:Transposase [Cordylochernes scorpioides]